MYTISKRWTFDAAHQLKGLPEGHKCGQLHGHTYTVEVELAAPDLDEHGFVVDFADLSPVKQFIFQVFDHKLLNDVMPTNPTAENIAFLLFQCVHNIYEARRLLAMHDDGPSLMEMLFPVNIKINLDGVKPLRDGVKLTAVRVSETGSSWAEFRP